MKSHQWGESGIGSGFPRDTRGAYIRRETRRGPHGIPAFVADVIGDRRRLWILFAVGITFLLGTGYWANHAIRDGLRRFQEEALETLLAANVKALLIWAEDERSFVESHATDPALRGDVEALIELAAAPPDPIAAIRDSEILGRLQDRFGHVVGERYTSGEEFGIYDEYSAFYVIDPAGMILASSDRSDVGERLRPQGLAIMRPVLDGRVVLSKPVEVERRADGRQGAMSQMMVAVAPVTDDDEKVIAVLAFTIDPEEEFTEILSVGRLGKTGETYAFDDRGMLLSESRYEDDLKDFGLMPNEPGARSSLQIQVRDPGGNLYRGHRNDTPVSGRPLTLAAANAVDGKGPGMDVHGYRDYRGVEVIGAWTWLPEYDVGVVTEVDADEANQLLAPLQRVFWGLLGITTFVTLAALFASHVVQRLSRGIDEVKQLGQYQLLRKIGEGGMGSVYLGRHAMLRRPTAIKLLKPDAMTTEGLARFEREVRITSELTHPNTIVIYDYGRTPEDLFYYAMEYLNGITLSKLIDVGGAVPAPRVLHILRHVCASLEEAHYRGLVHRDIKPPNVMVCLRGLDADVVKVLDFGLVKDVDAPDSIDITLPNIIGGTPMYIAPERLKDPTTLDARADLYALGAVAFNMLTGQPLYPGGSPMEIGYYALNSPTPRPSDVTSAPIPPELDQLIFECLSKDPNDRPDDAGVMLERLDAIEVDDPWTQVSARAWWAKHGELLDDDAGYVDAETVSRG